MSRTASVNLLSASAIVYALLAPYAVADLHESEEELNTRFGLPVRVVTDRAKVGPADTVNVYEQKGVTIYVYMLNGKSALEQYDFDKPISNADDQRVQAILKRHTDGDNWLFLPDARLMGEDKKYVWVNPGVSDATAMGALVRKTNPTRLEVQTTTFAKLLIK